MISAGSTNPNASSLAAGRNNKVGNFFCIQLPLESILSYYHVQTKSIRVYWSSFRSRASTCPIMTSRPKRYSSVIGGRSSSAISFGSVFVSVMKSGWCFGEIVC